MKHLFLSSLLAIALFGLAACDSKSSAGEAQAHVDDHAHTEGAEDAEDADQGHRETAHDEDASRETTIAADMALANGIRTAASGSAVLHEYINLYGRIRADAAGVRAVTARFPGILKSVSAQVGDSVTAGQTLATIESNESLQVYAVTAPISGSITQRAANPGELTGTGALFEIADFSKVWAELSVFPRDRPLLRPGQSNAITATDGSASGEGVIAYISPVGSASQALTARVVLDNRAGLWIPGQFVSARVAIAERSVALAVPQTALQELDGESVVFVVEGERYLARTVTLGRRDAVHAEVLDGLEPGTPIVVGNSYLLKADIEKSGAAHDH